MKFKCTTTEAKRIGETNVFQCSSFTVEAGSADEACVLAATLVPPPFRLFFVIEDEPRP